jgi:PelA/Pel-15E family pectate lyase
MKPTLPIARMMLGMLIVPTLLPPCVAAPVTAERIAGLVAGERPAWESYVAHSQAAAAADQAALAKELAGQGLSKALAAPSGGDFKLPEDREAAWFGSAEAAALATTVISYQTPAGGWSKHTGYTKGPRRPGMLWSSQYRPGKKPHYLGTFDNRSTTAQIRLLAAVWRATGRDDCRQAALRGLDYVLAAQYPHGGWPQVYPLEGGYHDAVTFNDDAMAHLLALVRDAAPGAGDFGFLDAPRREALAAALRRGLDCVMRAQIVRQGKPTGWCAQHDALTLEPIAARAMEPASISGTETANLLKCLMTLPTTDPRLTACIRHGLDWLERAKLTGLKRVKRDGETFYEEDPASDEAHWARFYSLADGKPIFPGRDGVIYPTFAAMAARNPLGYDFYSSRPAGVLGSSRKKWLKAQGLDD